MGDAGSVEQHKLPYQIAADGYLSAKDAFKSKGRGLRSNKFVPPGAASRVRLARQPGFVIQAGRPRDGRGKSPAPSAAKCCARARHRSPAVAPLPAFGPCS